MTSQTKKNKWIAPLCAALLVIIDQILKQWALGALPGAGRVEVIRGLFYLTYVENRGAAFGIFQGRTTVLAVLTAIVLLAVLIFMLKSKLESRLLHFSLTLVLAGGLGNLVDRITRGFVVDYFDFSAVFDFPVFNFADCCVVMGTATLLCWFVWSERKQGRRVEQEKFPSEHKKTEDADHTEA